MTAQPESERAVESFVTGSRWRDRRRATRFLAWSCLVALLWPQASHARQALVVRLATLVPDRSVWGKPLREMSAEWKAATESRVTVRLYPGGVAGDDPDLVRKMRIGQLQAATLTVTGLAEIDSAFALFEIPLFFDSYEEYFHVLEKMEPLLKERLKSKGFVFLHWGHAGWINLFTTRPVATVAELRQLKLFVWAGNDSMVSWWKDNGFRPVPLAVTDIPTGLQTGLIEALPSTPLAALFLQWFRSTPYMLDLSFAPLVGATVMTDSSWRKISESDQETMLAIARRAGERFRKEIPQQDRVAVTEMEKRGLTVTRVVGTEAEAEWREVAQRFAANMRDAYVPSDVFDLGLRERDRYRQRRLETKGN